MMADAHRNLPGLRQLGASFCLVMTFFSAPAAAQSAGPRIIKESKCKVLIGGSVDAEPGEVVPVLRRGSSTAVIGRIRILKGLGNRTTGRVVEPSSDCRAVLGGRLASRPISQGQSSVGGGKKGPPGLLRASVSAGPAIVNATLKGISRAAVVENYPLVLGSINSSLELFPFMFSGGNAAQSAKAGGKTDFKSVFGIDGSLRYVTSMGDIRVAVPSPTSGQEVVLNLGLSRLSFRGGALVRLPLWKGRLFLDGRGGYYYHRLGTTLTRFVSTPEGEAKPLDISPLRDLDLAGPYAMGGIQFQPVDNFRARLSTGTLFGSTYRIDNRIADSSLSAPKVYSNVAAPGLFLLEASFSYIFSRVHLGVDISLESFSGRALFPDGQNEGNVAEVYSSYGVNLGFLL
jgi:hypothetical protein